MNPLVIRAPFCIRSGYETLIETICLELSEHFDVFSISINGEVLNPNIKKIFKPLSKEIFNYTELCILPIQSDINDYNPLFRVPKIGKRVFFYNVGIHPIINECCGYIKSRKTCYST